jgi:hypothetical protein
MIRGWQSLQNGPGFTKNRLSVTSYKPREHLPVAFIGLLYLFTEESMKRLNRKEIISQFEEMRQGFKDVLSFGELDEVAKLSVKANHKYADIIIVKLGGLSVYLREKIKQ